MQVYALKCNMHFSSDCVFIANATIFQHDQKSKVTHKLLQLIVVVVVVKIIILLLSLLLLLQFLLLLLLLLLPIYIKKKNRLHMVKMQ